MLVLMLGGVDDNLPNFSHSFLGDHGWKDLPELKSNLDQKDIKKMIELSSREWLNVGQSADYLGVSTTTFREWRKKYKIPSYTIEGITRWSKSDLDAFWKRRGVEGYL